MRQVTVSLHTGHAMEVNFIIKKFMELSDVERRQLYNDFNGEDMETKVRASLEILKLLTDADKAELTQYANSTLGTNLSGYFVWNDRDNIVSRAIWLHHYFTANLKLEEEKVLIEPIPIKSFNK